MVIIYTFCCFKYKQTEHLGLVYRVPVLTGHVIFNCLRKYMLQSSFQDINVPYMFEIKFELNKQGHKPKMLTEPKMYLKYYWRI